MASLRRDASTLLGARLVGLAVPLIAIPVMSRRLGPEAFGDVAIGLAIYSFLATIMSYGFSISANRAVTMADGNRREIQRIFQAVALVQLCVSVAFVLCLAVVAALVPMPSLLFWSVVGGVLSTILSIFFPSWAFQGLRMLQEGALVEVVSRILAVGVLFAFVRGPNDALLAFLTQVMWVLPASLYSVVRFWKLGYISVDRIVERTMFPRLLREGAGPFLRNFVVNFYTALNTLALGAVVGSTSVAVFTGADKLIAAARLPTMPIKQSFFPRLVSAIAKEDSTETRRLSSLMLKLYLTTFVGGAVVCFVVAPRVLRWYLGAGFEASGAVARILVLSLPFIGVSLWAETVLQALGNSMRSAYAFAFGALAHAIYLVPLILALGVVGASIGVVVTEVIICGVMLWQFHKCWSRRSATLWS